MSTAHDNKREAQRNMMLNAPILKVIPVIAIPMIISMLIDSVYNMTDTYFVSQLGTAATAAVGVNDSLMQYIRAFAMGFGVGACSYLSRLLGAKKDDEANRVASTTLFTAVGIMTVLMIIAYAFMSPLVTLLGATPTVKPHSMDYAKYILISAPFTAGEVVLAQLLRSEGNTKYSMIGMVTGCVINVVLDPILISVVGWGVAGAAIATSISKIISFCILLMPFLKRKSIIELGWKYFTPKWQLYVEVLKMGVPTFLRSALMTSSFVLINNVAGGFSDAALAAVSISKKSTGFVASAIMGFGQGFQPLAGFCWGAKKYKRVRDAFWICTFIGWGAAVVLGITMGAFSKQLVQIFTTPDQTELIRIGALMIFSQCCALIPHVWGVVVNGLCQAMGKPLYSTLVGLARNFICLIPSVLIMPKLFGINGLAVSQATSDALSLVIVIPIVISLLKEIRQHEVIENAEEESSETIIVTN